MSGSNDAQLQALLLQMRQQRQPSTQSRLAQQMMAANMQQAQTPIWGTGATLARAGSGVLAGLMGGMAERSDRQREEQQQQAVIDRSEKRDYLQGQEAAAFGQRFGLVPAAPNPDGSPAAPQAAPNWRQAALEGFGSNNPAIQRQAQAALSIGQLEDQQAARVEQMRLQRELAAASRAPRAPSEFEQMAAAAGIRPGTPEFQQMARTMLDRRVQGAGPSEVRAGLNPVQAYDADGNPTILLPRTDGTVTRPDLPEGVSLTPRTREINTGTEILTVDQGGRVQQRRPVDIRGREAAEVQGRDDGTQATAAPQAFRTATQSLQAIDGIINHPALRAATGATAFTGALPGTPMMDFRTRVEQLQGQAFLQAFESLRGGGAITEIEGRKATDAIARLNRSVSASDFRTALGEIRDVVEAARQRAQARLPRDPAAPPGSTQNPAEGPRRLRFNPATGDFE
jgi:hypothetical protein